MTPRLVLSTLAAALLIGACSSDGGATTTPTSASSAPRVGTTTTTADTPATTSVVTTDPSPSSTAPPTTDETTTTSDAPPATEATQGDDDFTDAEVSDRGVARTALITLSDFPEGWVEDPIEEADDLGTDEFEAEFDACLGRDDHTRVGDELDRLRVGTGDFHPVDVDTTTVSHEVVLAPDVDTALAVMADLRIDGAESCLASVIGDFYRARFADDPELREFGVGEVIVSRTESGRDPDVELGVLLEVPLTIGDQSVSQFLELLYQRQGRALSELSFSSLGERFDRDGYTALSDESIIRLADIGG